MDSSRKTAKRKDQKLQENDNNRQDDESRLPDSSQSQEQSEAKKDCCWPMLCSRAKTNKSSTKDDKDQSDKMIEMLNASKIREYVEEFIKTEQTQTRKNLKKKISDEIDAIKKELKNDDTNKNVPERKDDADNYNGETVLHTAVKCLQFDTEPERLQFKTKLEQEVVELFIDNFPELIGQSRSKTEYEGQTPLHMAVCKSNKWLVKTFLEKLDSNEKKKLLELKATGKMFRDTVMMGELPLTIAALTFNEEIFNFLLNDGGAELDLTNSKGDNVCHSLIRYGRLYPDKKTKVMDMFRKILDLHKTQDKKNENSVYHNNKKVDPRELLTRKNKEGLSTLQLSLKLGFHEMFELIMDEWYCTTNFSDGLFEIKKYKFTELDPIAKAKRSTNSEIKPDKKPTMHTTEKENVQHNQSTDENTERSMNNKTKKQNQSVLMLLFDLDPDVAFQFIQFQKPTRLLVDHKWNYYRTLVYSLGVFHFLFICFLTWYSAERSLQHSNTGNGYDVNLAPEYVKQIGKSPFVTAFGIISFIVGVICVAQEVVRIKEGQMPFTWKSFWNPYGCGFFRIFFILFGVGLILDFILAVSLDWYENYLLILSVVLGWFLNIFYIRTVKYFSFFTVLMQNVLISDMTRFFVIISFELMAFSTAMYMAIQGSNTADDPNYSNFGRVIFSMFSLTVGLGDAADFYQTRRPVLCILIFILFVITTTLLMINALIAMMSETCTELVENVGSSKSHERHTILQRLSVILFLESILMTMTSKNCKVDELEKRSLQSAETSLFKTIRQSFNQTFKRNRVSPANQTI